MIGELFMLKYDVNGWQVPNSTGESPRVGALLQRHSFALVLDQHFVPDESESHSWLFVLIDDVCRWIPLSYFRLPVNVSQEKHLK